MFVNLVQQLSLLVSREERRDLPDEHLSVPADGQAGERVRSLQGGIDHPHQEGSQHKVQGQQNI